MKETLNEILDHVEAAFHLTAKVSARGGELDAMSAVRQELRLAYKTARTALDEMEKEGTHG